MNGRLEGKTALVTGAAAGIGRAVSEAFAGEGARVWATDIDTHSLSALEALDGITGATLDVRSVAAISALYERTGPVDVLFNCAGMVTDGGLLDCSEADWDASFELNVRSMYLMLRRYLPDMVRAGRGSVINVASVASSISGVARRCAYGASKAAVIGLTRSVAADYIGDGVRCNAICPGTVDTPSLQARINAQPDPDAARRAFVARQPMGRLGRAAEIAAAAVYLASDESCFVTSTNMVIDGGMTL